MRSVCFWSFLSAPERLCVVVAGRFCDVVGGGAGRGAAGATTEEGARGGASGARSVGGRRVHCSSAPGRGGSADSAPASGSEDGGVDVVAVAVALGWFAWPRRSVVVFVFAGAAVEDAFFVLRAGELGNKASVRRFPAALSALISSLNSLICFFCRSHVARSDLSSFAEAAFVASSAVRAVPGNPPDANLALTSASRSARSRITSAVALFNLSISASARIRLNRSSLAVRRSNADSVPFDADAARPRRPNASVPPHASSNDSYRDLSVTNASRSESRTLSLSSNRRKSSAVPIVAADVDAFSRAAPPSRAESSASSSSSFSAIAAATAAAFIANLAAIAAAGLVDVARRFFAISTTERRRFGRVRFSRTRRVQRTHFFCTTLNPRIINPNLTVHNPSILYLGWVHSKAHFG